MAQIVYLPSRGEFRCILLVQPELLPTIQADFGARSNERMMNTLILLQAITHASIHTTTLARFHHSSSFDFSNVGPEDAFHMFPYAIEYHALDAALADKLCSDPGFIHKGYGGLGQVVNTAQVARGIDPLDYGRNSRFTASAKGGGKGKGGRKGKARLADQKAPRGSSGDMNLDSGSFGRTTNGETGIVTIGQIMQMRTHRIVCQDGVSATTTVMLAMTPDAMTVMLAMALDAMTVVTDAVMPAVMFVIFAAMFETATLPDALDMTTGTITNGDGLCCSSRYLFSIW